MKSKHVYLKHETDDNDKWFEITDECTQIGDITSILFQRGIDACELGNWSENGILMA